jgi:hypothetical protein
MASQLNFWHDQIIFVQRIDAEGIRMLLVPTGPYTVRAVTHYHITSKDIDQALGVISKVMK